jgi:hypothetical protein
MISTGIAYHTAVVAATTTDLATTTGGAITYSQPNGAANGVGALLTTTGSFNLIDSANVQTVGIRILVKNEANAVLNGVYTWANATNIIRSTDADQYGPNSDEQLSVNDYFFVTGGNVNLGSAYIVSAPTGVITFGTSNIDFNQFSSSQVYSANTNAGLTLVGQTFNAKVDNNTTAFDLNGNIIVKASANLTTPNIGAATGTSLSATGNVVGGNVLTGGLVSATGNVTGGNLIAANAFIGNINVTGNVSVNSLTSNTIVSAAGNVTGGNILTGGLVSATGNITGGNLITAGILTATGNIISVANISGGNFLTTGAVSAGGNILTSGMISATGNLYGLLAEFGNTIIGSLGVSTAGNLTANGFISATGNVTGNYFIGNGAQLTGIISTSIANGNTNINIPAANGNIEISVNGAANTAFISLGSFTLNGAFAGPKTLDATVVVEEAVNAMLLGPVSLAANTTIFVPTTSTLYIYAP